MMESDIQTRSPETLPEVGAPNVEPSSEQLSPKEPSGLDEVAMPSSIAPDVASPSTAAPDVASPSPAAPDVLSPSFAAPDVASPSTPAAPSPGAREDGLSASPSTAAAPSPSAREDTSPSPATPRGGGPLARLSLSPRRSPEPSPSTLGTEQDNVSQAVQSHLFGADKNTQAKPSGHRSKAVRREIQQRIQAPRREVIEQLDPQCTFRPEITEASRAIAEGNRGTDEEPRFVALSRPNDATQQKIMQFKQAAADLEMAPCTFKPDLDAKKMKGLASKFMDSGYAKYKKKKPEQDSPPIAAAADPKLGSPSPRSPRAEFTFSSGRSSPASPRLAGSVQPTGLSPLGAYRNAEDEPGSTRGAAVHIARARAAREQKVAREEKFAKMGQPVNENQWQSRRATTTPAPFTSHTGIRNKQRNMTREGRAMENIDVTKVYKELHEQLHSLELGSGPGWFS